MIHGSPKGLGILSWVFGLSDWTHGCISVRHFAMGEICASVEGGTPIHILP